MRFSYLLLFVIFLAITAPAVCYGFNNNEITQEKDLCSYIKNTEEEIQKQTFRYENEISHIKSSLENLRIYQKYSDNEEVTQNQTENSDNKDIPQNQTENKDTSPDDLQKRIEELEQKLLETTKNYEAQINELIKSLEDLKKEQQELKDKIEIQQALQTMETPVPEIPNEHSGQVSQSLGPSISVVGDILFSNVDPLEGNIAPADLTEHHHDHDDHEAEALYALHTEEESTGHTANTNDLQLRELELAFQGVLDPFGRADVFLGIHGDHLHIEEGFLTLLHLPGPLQARLGKFRLPFGQANKTHRPALNMVNYPNLVTNFFGDEGLSSPGGELSVLLPIETYVEFRGAVVTGGGESPSFAADDNYIYMGHVKTFFELNENHSLELGGSYINGKHDVENRLNTQMEGIDITYRWQPTDDPYSSFLLQGEMLFSQRDLLHHHDDEDDTMNSYAYYLLAQYQLSRRWYLGMRYDYSEFPFNNRDHENAYSLALSFAMSDATRFRLQYTHTDRTFGDSSDSIYFQTTFTLGEHKH